MSTRTYRARFARLVTVLVIALTTALGALALTAPSAEATGHHRLGTRSLAAVLAADGTGFDHNWNDFDILDNAVRAVLAAKPNSAVAVLADGKTTLTAFLPTDRAFRRLAHDVTGKSYSSEPAVLADVASLGIDNVEAVLLYHVIPGARITYRDALRSDGAVLTTALRGATVTVNVRWCFFVELVDADTDDRNPYVIAPNINSGNRQIGHGIDRVLRPIDL